MGVHFRKFMNLSRQPHPPGPSKPLVHHIHWWLLLAVLIVLFVIAVRSAGS
jgi:hypothetical protein